MKHDQPRLSPEFSESEEENLRFLRHEVKRGKIGGPEDTPSKDREFALQPEPPEWEKLDPAWRSLSPEMRAEVIDGFFNAAHTIQEFTEQLRQLSEKGFEFTDEKEHAAFVKKLRDVDDPIRVGEEILEFAERGRTPPRATLWSILNLYEHFARPEHTEKLGQLLLRDDVALNGYDRNSKSKIVSLLGEYGSPEAIPILRQYAEKVRSCEYEPLQPSNELPADLFPKLLEGAPTSVTEESFKRYVDMVAKTQLPLPALRRDDQGEVLKTLDQLAQRLSMLPMPQRQDVTQKIQNAREYVTANQKYFDEEFSRWREEHPEWIEAMHKAAEEF